MSKRLFTAWLAAVLLAGCVTAPRATIAPLKSAPSTAPAAAENGVVSRSFDRLWQASADEARHRMFTIDREDYRGGVLTTAPLISAQFFEPWRRDAITLHAVAQSSLSSIRRTIRFEFTRYENGTFSVVPHVEVERYSAAERRLTSATLYRSAFKKTSATGTLNTDQGIVLPARYWYNVGSDSALERDLAKAIRRRL